MVSATAFRPQRSRVCAVGRPLRSHPLRS
jgi:hypothetical protein